MTFTPIPRATLIEPPSVQAELDFEMNVPANWPDDTQRLVIVGTTGSGKTHGGLWHVSRRNYDEKPWVIYDWKRDPLIASIEGTVPLSVDAPAPRHPGIYIVRPVPDRDDDAVEAQMRSIWDAEDIGVFVDEGYMVSRTNYAFRSLLTQGRSKHIPMIILSQRPVFVDRFVFTESEYKQVFKLLSDDDYDNVGNYVPPLKRSNRGRNWRWPLQKRWSYYYDAGEDRMHKMEPLPDWPTIQSIFRRKMARIREVI